MAQASIGPGIAVFSRYREVLEPDDSPMSVRSALMLINQELDAFLSQQEGEYESETRFALTWFEEFGLATGDYGRAETAASARNVSVQGVVAAGIFFAQAGKARLLRRDELAAGWSPQTDPRVTVWECCQHLIRRLEDGGEEAAARLLVSLLHYGPMVRDLAYRLYSLCERKGWAEEARAYNGLIVAWPELLKIAETLPQGQEAAAQGVLAV